MLYAGGVVGCRACDALSEGINLRKRRRCLHAEGRIDVVWSVAMLVTWRFKVPVYWFNNLRISQPGQPTSSAATNPSLSVLS